MDFMDMNMHMNTYRIFFMDNIRGLVEYIRALENLSDMNMNMSICQNFMDIIHGEP